jgi:hypothetical protein
MRGCVTARLCLLAVLCTISACTFFGDAGTPEDGTGVVPQPGKWHGEGCAFFVSADGRYLTPTGSPFYLDGEPYSLGFRFVETRERCRTRGGFCVYRDALPIRNGIVKRPELNMEFESTTSCKGFFDHTYSDDVCGTVRESATFTAAPM